jgi:hypothetical protein
LVFAPGSSSTNALEMYQKGVNMEDCGTFHYEGLKYHFNRTPNQLGVSSTRDNEENFQCESSDCI